jgi:hypothetical protein
MDLGKLRQGQADTAFMLFALLWSYVYAPPQRAAP